MAANGIEGQGRAVFICVDDLSIGDQTQLDEGLKSVADAADQTVAPLQQLGDSLADLCVAEEGGDELSGAVRLIAAGEAAGNEDHLAFLQAFGKGIDAAGNAFGGKVVHHEDLRFRSRVTHGTGAVNLTVGAGESGDQDTGLCRPNGGGNAGRSRVGEGLRYAAALGNVAGIDRLELAFVEIEKFLPVDELFTQTEGTVVDDGSDELCIGDVLFDFQQESAVVVSENSVAIQAVGKTESEAVAEGHLHDGLCDTAHAGGITGDSLSAAEKLRNPVEETDQGICRRKSVGARFRSETNDLVSGLLEFVRHNVMGFPGGDGEGDQRRRNMQLLKGAAHGVLATDRADAEPHLRFKGAQQRGKGLAPAAAVSAEAFKVLLEAEIHIPEGCAGGDKLADRLNDGEIGPVIRALFGDEGVIPPGHERTVVGVLLLHGNLLDHGLDRGELILSAEGHQHRSGTDGGVETLTEPAFGAAVEIRRGLAKERTEGAGDRLCPGLRFRGDGVNMFFRTVGV